MFAELKTHDTRTSAIAAILWMEPQKTSIVKLAGGKQSTRGLLAPDRLRVLVLAQPNEARMPKMVVGGPFDELELPHELRFSPNGILSSSPRSAQLPTCRHSAQAGSRRSQASHCSSFISHHWSPRLLVRHSALDLRLAQPVR